MKKLCIVGGMGPLATADFYKRIVLNSPAKKDQEHIETLILSDVLIPDRTEAIIRNDSAYMLERFQKNFDYAKKWGADFIAIPCNTAHYYMDEYQKMTDIKIIDMVRECVKIAKEETYVFSTVGTYQSGIYKKRLEEEGKICLELTDREKAISNDTIYRIKSGEQPLLKNFATFKELLLEKKAEGKGVILACTELSMLDAHDENVIDAMDILVKKVISEAYKFD